MLTKAKAASKAWVFPPPPIHAQVNPSSSRSIKDLTLLLLSLNTSFLDTCASDFASIIVLFPGKVLKEETLESKVQSSLLKSDDRNFYKAVCIGLVGECKALCNMLRRKKMRHLKISVIHLKMKLFLPYLQLLQLQLHISVYQEVARVDQ